MSHHRSFRLALSSLALAVVAVPACWAQDDGTAVIESGSSVSIEYTLKLADGTTVDTNVGREPLTYTQGTGEILPALDEALLGSKVGDTREVGLTAEQGYGPINPEAFQEIPLEQLPEDARSVGTMLMATGPEGQQVPVRVHEVKEETIVMDFNHPLAGEALTFDIKILTIE